MTSIRVRVLLVEDDERLSESLCGYLARYLYAVTAVSTVHAACEEIAQGAFDVIIQDWILPDGDGRVVLDFAKENSPETARVVYSAHVTSDAESTAAGSHQFVEKGSDIGRLRNAIIRSLEMTQHFQIANQTPLSVLRSFQDWVGEQAAVRSRLTESRITAVFGLQGCDFLSRSVAEWYGCKTHPEVRFHEIKCGSSNNLQGELGDYVFGKCTLRGRESVVTKGVIDSTSASHLHFSNAEQLDAKDVRRLVATAQDHAYRRDGAQRDLCFSGTISLNDTDAYSPNQHFVTLMAELDIPVFALPRTPLELCGVRAWSEQLAALNCSLDGLENVLARVGVFDSWRRLFHCATAMLQPIGSVSELLTKIPLFEQTFDDERGHISDWKQIADLPRFVYVSWLLQRTGGNIAEASRVARLSRPAIYAAIAETAPEK